MGVIKAFKNASQTVREVEEWGDALNEADHAADFKQFADRPRDRSGDETR